MHRAGFTAALSFLTLGFGLCALPLDAQISAAPTLVNFQGRLATPAGNPVPNGTYSIRFSLWSALIGGTEKWTQTIATVQVRNGTFAVPLNVSTGAADKFNGNLWLEIKIGADAALTPRTPLVTVPYAFKAGSVVDGSITSASIANATITAEKFASNLFNTTAWLLSGNSATDPVTHFLGTTDNSPLIFKVNTQRGLRLEYALNIYDMMNGYYYEGVNVLGGHSSNTIMAGVVGGTIAGGGYRATSSGGETLSPNTVTDYGGTVGGGTFNTAGNSNSDVRDVRFATVAGGNANQASGYGSAVAGGIENRSQGHYAFTAGIANVASGFASTIPGGSSNLAIGNYSFAGGYRAQANYTGSFVWADHSTTPDSRFNDVVENQFCIQAYGGMMLEMGRSPFVFTSSTAGEKGRYLELYNSPQTSSASGLKAGGILCADDFGYASPPKNDLVVKGRACVGYNSAFPYTFAVNGTTFCSAGYTSSDARYKKNITLLDNALQSVLSLRGVYYDWDKAKFPTQNFGDGKQVGFIAQEIERVFPHLVMTAPDGYKAVNYVGVIPVLVEAVKTLKSKHESEIKALKSKNIELESTLLKLAERLSAVEAEQRKQK